MTNVSVPSLKPHLLVALLLAPSVNSCLTRAHITPTPPAEWNLPDLVCELTRNGSQNLTALSTAESFTSRIVPAFPFSVVRSDNGHTKYGIMNDVTTDRERMRIVKAYRLLGDRYPYVRSVSIHVAFL